jgi:uncharacterized RDD family membrane protein YckC
MAVAAALTRSGSGWALEARQARRRRTGALLIDLVAFGLISLVVNNVYGVTQVTSGMPLLTIGGGSAYFTTSTSIPWPWLCLLWMAYYMVPEGLYGASLGKLFTGLCVVRADGRPVGFGAVVVRNLMRFVDVLPGLYLLGGVVVLLGPESRRLGDLVAGTTVVRRDLAEAGATRRPLPGSNRLLAIALVTALLCTIAFDYFGRPPLVIAGLYNQHELLEPDISSYELGPPTWELGRVTYPFTAYRGWQPCTGSIALQWSPGGWDLTDAQLLCKP